MEPLLRIFWKKILQEVGFTDSARQERDALLEAQEAERALLGHVLRRCVSPRRRNYS